MSLPFARASVSSVRLLFICLGNICRSPTAEAVARAKGHNCDSAGTADWHRGKAPYGRMQAAARARGYDMSTLRARPLTPADFVAFDQLIVMDAENAADVETRRPAGDETPITRLTDYIDTGEDHVPDPYYTRDFEGALDLIERCVARLPR